MVYALAEVLRKHFLAYPSRRKPGAKPKATTAEERPQTEPERDPHFTRPDMK